MEFHMGEKTSMLQKVFEKTTVQASNLRQGDYVPQDTTTGFRRHGGDPIRGIPNGEIHGEMIESMDSKNVARKAHAAHWTHEEDEKLRRRIMRHGNKRPWLDIASALPGRSGKQCRERWINHLDTKIKKESWTQAEEAVLVDRHRKLGNKWAKIASQIPGRPENTIKNHWYATERSVQTKLRNNKEDNRPGILENYVRSVLIKEGKGTQQGVLTGPVHAAGRSGHKVTVPFAGSSFAGSSQAPPSFPGLVGGEKFSLEPIYDNFLLGKQEYLPYPYPVAPGHHYSGYAEDHQLGGGYSFQPPQLPQHPIYAQQQQEQAFINYNLAEEDPIGEVFAGRYYHDAGPDQMLLGLYYHHAGPSHYDNNGGGGNHAGFYEAAGNNGLDAMPPARANEGPWSSLNPPAPGPGGYY